MKRQKVTGFNVTREPRWGIDYNGKLEMEDVHRALKAGKNLTRRERRALDVLTKPRRRSA
jgi:hypothetical protein